MALSGWADGIYVDHGSAAALDNMTTGTILAWIFSTDNNSRQVITAKGATGNFAWTLFETDPTDTLEWSRQRTAGTFNQATAPLANFTYYGINKWIFVALTWDTVTDANNKLWCGDRGNPAIEPSAYSAQLAGTGALGTDATGNLRVGRHNSAAGRQFIGRIAWFSLYSTRLIQERIQFLQFSPITLPNCLINTHYGWNGATGINADWSGNLNNGTAVGTPTLEDHVPFSPPFGLYGGWMGNFTPSGGAPTAFPEHYYRMMRGKSKFKKLDSGLYIPEYRNEAA